MSRRTGDVRIHRSRLGDHFTQIPDETLRDERLSYVARGVLCELLSRPEDWDTTADQMAAYARIKRGGDGEGRRTIRGAFAELRAAGYMITMRVPRPGGQWGSEVHVYDQPQADVPASGTSGRPAKIQVSSGGTGVPASGTPAAMTGVPASGTSARPAETEVSPVHADVPLTEVPVSGTSLRTQRTKRSSSGPLERIVLDATDATAEEARDLVQVILTDKKPRSPSAYLRRVAENGDLQFWLQQLRDSRSEQSMPRPRRLTVEELRRGPTCEHGDPGGSSLHPTYGTPLCPKCRLEASRRSA